MPSPHLQMNIHRLSLFFTPVSFRWTIPLIMWNYKLHNFVKACNTMSMYTLSVTMNFCENMAYLGGPTKVFVLIQAACPCCIPSLHHHAACPCPCCMSTLHIDAVCPVACRFWISMLHEHAEYIIVPIR
jgi:hypothetical protein